MNRCSPRGPPGEGRVASVGPKGLARMLGHRTRVPVVNRPKVEQVTDHPHHLSDRSP